MTNPPPYSQFLAPRHWPTWLGIGLLCLAALAPLRARLWLGARLGDLTRRFARERRYITQVNIARCFPELNATERAALVRRSFQENGIGLVETACGWIRPASRFKPLSVLRNGELIEAALTQGRGVLFLGAHYTTLDFAANLLSQYFPFAVTYRAHKNPLFDAFMLRGRLRNCNGVFDRNDVRGALRHLRQGKILWYAPDQDYGPEQSVYAPFFGNNAATITVGARFASFNRSPTFVVRHHRGTGRAPYELEAIPFPGYPSGDDQADAARLNLALEEAIRVNPAQYLWMHKRFKTQPGGKPQSPYIFIKTPNRKLDITRCAALLEGSMPQAQHADRLTLASGLELRRFGGLASGPWQRRHPALRLDQRSKLLRAQGIATVTVDSLFRVPHLQQTFATCFIPQGSRVSAATVAPSTAAALLQHLHAIGASFPTLQAGDLQLTDAGLAIDDPLRLRLRSGQASYQERREDLRQLAAVLGYDPEQEQQLQQHYLRQLRADIRQDLQAQLAATGHPTDNGAPDSH